MSFRPTTMERAFTLARSGEYSGIDEIRKQLKAEGLNPYQIEGPSLLRQLRQMCLDARAAKEA